MKHSASSDVLDAKRLSDLRALAGPDAPELAAEIAVMFLDTCRSSITELTEATTAADPTGVREASHRIKGSSGNVGAMRLHDICEEIELEAREGRVPANGPERVQAEFDRVHIALRKEFDLADDA